MTRHQPPETRKRQILDAASECFARAGYQASRMEDIASRCGLSKGALYHQYDSKSAIVQALAQRWVERAVSGLSEQSADAPADLNAALQPQLFVVLLAESARQPELAKMLADGIDSVTHALGEQLAPGLENQWDALVTLLLGVMVRSAVQDSGDDAGRSSSVASDSVASVSVASMGELVKALRSNSKPRYRVQYVDSRA
ncbi:MAG: TetR/AcrR family transcriptional regulator [Pseudomonadaceae bacterium]|nr:TetR/AcrR family transcriptional regulator [Pseudomonadaceae bacterium]